MRFNKETEKAINEKAQSIVILSGCEVAISNDLVIVNHMGCCKIDEVSGLIKSLEALKTIIEDQTGVVC